MTDARTLSRSTKVGSEVWSVLYRLETNTYEPSPVGRVQRVTREGVIVGGRLIGWTEHPVGTEAEMREWARNRTPNVPTIK